MDTYHGTNVLFRSIDLSNCRNRTDFGKGFYLSDKIGTAQKWAINRTGMRRTGTPTILRYSINYAGLIDLYGCRFPIDPTVEWLDFVGSNRRFAKKDDADKEPRHDYHWVSGPIADDKMNDVVEEYLAGDIAADEAIRRARILPRTFQLSLHTYEAIEFISDDDISYKQYKNGRWLPHDSIWSVLD